MEKVTDKAQAKAEEVAHEATSKANDLADKAEQKADEVASDTSSETPTGSSVDMTSGAGVSGPGTTRPPRGLDTDMPRTVVDMTDESTTTAGSRTPGSRDQV